MPMSSQPLQPLPEFASEDEEREFWATHDSADYFDLSKAEPVPPGAFPKLKRSPRVLLSIQVSDTTLHALHALAARRGVPYQVLARELLAASIEQERRSA